MNFYAIKEDREDILSLIFRQKDWQVYDSYSEYGGEIIKYTSAVQVEERISRVAGTSLFVIYSPEFGGELDFRKINLNSDECDGHTFRFQTTGWGLIHLDFGMVRNNRLDDSRISHNSEIRANKWFPHYPEWKNPDLWDWKEIKRASHKVENMIKKLSVGKYGLGYVMPNAEFIDKWPDLTRM